MSSDTENIPGTNEPSRTGITRRTFVKRTTATVLVTALALHAFRNEALAAEEGGSSGAWLVIVDSLAKADGRITLPPLPGGTPTRMILGFIPPIPDPRNTPPNASQTVEFGILGLLQYSLDGGATWITSDTVSISTGGSASNPNSPNYGDLIATQAGQAGEIDSGDTLVLGVQLVLRQNYQQVEMTITAILAQKKEYVNDYFNNDGVFVIDVDDDPPPPLTLKEAAGMLPVTGSASAGFTESYYPDSD
jgi:hypothetical protein